MDDANLLREFILNATYPTVIRKFRNVNWPCFANGMFEWAKMFDYCEEPVTFTRLTKLSRTPQWERKSECLKLTMTEFVKEHSQPQQYWTGMHYKRANDIPPNCSAGVDFSCFGFNEASKNDITFWLSSEGGNTQCHYDSYGCNIVVQIFGRKSWLLFPPNTPLKEIRIPYEESSVYCKENFYSPNPNDMTALEALEGYAYFCIMEPQDVLILPRHWWHFVESLEMSLSVNYWVPLCCDRESQIDECIVHYLISQCVGTSPNRPEHKYVYNPNQISEMLDKKNLLRILGSLCTGKDTSLHRHSYEYKPPLLTKDFPKMLMERVEPLTTHEWKQFLHNNSKRFLSSEEVPELKPLNALEEELINSICSPQVVKSIRNMLDRRLTGQ